MIYVIATELADPERNGAAIEGWIRSNFDSWTHPIENLWVVEGPLVADQIHTALEPHLTAEDRLVLIKTGTEAMWQGISATSAEWFADVFPGSLSERIPGKTEGLTR
jgi:hypothetical protein